jgi:pimeloyl-ACP methyl ester carboxylesterase
MTPVLQPPTSFDDDVTAMTRVLNCVDGPYVLGGQGYAGAIKSKPGNDYHVKSLSYITAHALDAGVAMADNSQKSLGEPASIVCTPDNFAYLKPPGHPSLLAPELTLTQAEFEAHAQIPLAAFEFPAQASDPAWKTMPIWYVAAKADRIISPARGRMHAARAHANTVEIDGASHAVFESRPREVAAMIEHAAPQSSQLTISLPSQSPA